MGATAAGKLTGSAHHGPDHPTVNPRKRRGIYRDILYFLCQAFILLSYYNGLSIVKSEDTTYPVKKLVLFRRVFLPLRQAQIKHVGELSA